ncbi:MAG TPA: MarR family winged helix-turn-helix transcriptional regulator, partial [Chitinophagaceae bacterium]|nr:MarR family winged helix-turn-helix transcriptional regulator [Chitinophagaceae bacterium]
GRSADSTLNTLIVQLNRYARMYAKSAIWGSDFTTQEEFIYLINLKSLGAMTKIELIKNNIHDKPFGIKTIERLINQGWVVQKDSTADRRSKIIDITPKGLNALEQQMDKIRKASTIVTGDLDYNEKMELIRLLTKLDQFHKPIFSANIDSQYLLQKVYSNYLAAKINL